MTQERIYSVYLITLSNGKLYFGCTRNIKARHKSMACYKRNTSFYDALKAEGWKNVKKEVITDHLSKTDAEKIEAWLIDRYDTCNPLKGYNLQRGAHTVNASTKEGKKEYNRIWRQNHPGYCSNWKKKFREEHGVWYDSWKNFGNKKTHSNNGKHTTPGAANQTFCSMVHSQRR